MKEKMRGQRQQKEKEKKKSGKCEWSEESTLYLHEYYEAKLKPPRRE